MIENTPAKQLYERVQRDFNFSLHNRLHIAPEVQMFRTGEDESLWKQKKEGQFTYQVFFDGEFVCFFEISQDQATAYYNVMKGLRDLYKSGKIHWNKELYEFDKQAAKIEAKENEPKIKKPETEGEKIAQELIDRRKKRKNNNKK